MTDIKKLKEIIEGALEFYASKANYQRDFGDDPAVMADYGDKATKALAAIEAFEMGNY